MAIDKVVDSTQLNSDLTSVANAIRAKGGTSAQLAFPSGFVSAINDISAGGMTITETLDVGGGTIIEISGDTTIVEPITITENGTTTAPTGKAYSPITVDVPSGYNVDDIATRNYSGDIIIQTATILRPYAFSYSNITSISSESLEQGNESCFRACSNLECVNLPNIRTTSDGSAVSWFESCTSLSSIYLPKVDRVWNYMFRGCTSLKTLVLPSLYQLSRPNSVDGDTALEKIDFGGKNTANPNSLENNWFKNCTSFNTLVLRYPRLVSLSGTGAFNGTPFASGGTGGTLYVPQDYISSYQSATNWSTILGYTNNQIKSIESTHTDPNAPIDLTIYYADGTPISA